jgi:hypothetical protein
LARRSFEWRGESYRLDSSIWHFWGHARLIQLPGQDAEFRMTPDDTLFIQFAVKVGFRPQEDLDHPKQLNACQTYLEQNGHQVWTARGALQIACEDSDTELSARLLTA